MTTTTTNTKLTALRLATEETLHRWNGDRGRSLSEAEVRAATSDDGLFIEFAGVPIYVCINENDGTAVGWLWEDDDQRHLYVAEIEPSPVVVRTNEMRDAEMVALAKRRATVMLRDGTSATLIRWRGESPNTARVRFANGRSYTVPAAHVWSVQLPTTKEDQ